MDQVGLREECGGQRALCMSCPWLGHQQPYNSHPLLRWREMTLPTDHWDPGSWGSRIRTSVLGCSLGLSVRCFCLDWREERSFLRKWAQKLSERIWLSCHWQRLWSSKSEYVTRRREASCHPPKQQIRGLCACRQQHRRTALMHYRRCKGHGWLRRLRCEASSPREPWKPDF